MEERPLFGFSLACFFVVSFGIISFALCITAEVKKTKIKDLRLDGKLCSLPGSDSSRLGIAGLVCFCIAQVIGGLIIALKYRNPCLGDHDHDVGRRSSGWNWKKGGKVTLSTLFLSISWINFGITVILLVTASSMSQRQDNGQGWLDGECYLVKDGVFSGSGILVLVSVTLTLISCILSMKKSRVEQGQNVGKMTARV